MLVLVDRHVEHQGMSIDKLELISSKVLACSVLDSHFAVMRTLAKTIITA